MHKLTARQIENFRDPGTYEDGAGLRLLVDDRGNKRWRYRYQLRGKRREMGLGSFPIITLKAARDTAAAHRSLLAKGIDPLEAKAAEDAERKAQEFAGWTFKEAADDYVLISAEK